MRRLLVLLCGIVGLLSTGSVAQAAVSVSVGNGTVNPDGSATVPVSVSCDPGRLVLEAHLTLSQDDQTISGMSGIANVRCTGRVRTYLVTVTPSQGAFHAGTAFASPFVLVQDRRTGQTESGGNASNITLQ
jgi:hypothetical protein